VEPRAQPMRLLAPPQALPGALVDLVGVLGLVEVVVALGEPLPGGAVGVAERRDGDHRGSVVLPIRLSSIARAHCRPSRIAHPTRDWPGRMSPAANSLGTEVL